jgi:hypothetical protein
LASSHTSCSAGAPQWLQFNSSGLLLQRPVGALLHQTGDIMSNEKFNFAGDLFDACSCHAPCPCWVGQDADGEECDSSRLYHITSGTIDGVEVNGLSVVTLERTPVPARNAGWQKVILIDRKADKKQRETLQKFFLGQIGDQFTDLHELMGNRVDVESAEIFFSHDENQDPIIKVHGIMLAEMKPFLGDNGQPITMQNAKKGAPNATTLIGSNKIHSVTAAKYNFDWSFTKRSAMLTKFEYKNK